MRLTLACVGRMKAGADRDLVERYVVRAQSAGRPLGLAFETREFEESRARRDQDRRKEEAASLDTALGSHGAVLVFDETGASVDSPDFASLLGRHRDGGTPTLAFVIGGPDGLDRAYRDRASHVVAFGAMTWPHQLVRIMAAEQIYRAITILAGHPYHRG